MPCQEDLRLNPFQEGENDAQVHGHSHGAQGAKKLGVKELRTFDDPLSLPSGPITRLRAKNFKEALQGLIQAICEDMPSKGAHGNGDGVALIEAEHMIMED